MTIRTAVIAFAACIQAGLGIVRFAVAFGRSDAAGFAAVLRRFACDAAGAAVIFVGCQILAARLFVRSAILGIRRTSAPFGSTHRSAGTCIPMRKTIVIGIALANHPVSLIKQMIPIDAHGWPACGIFTDTVLPSLKISTIVEAAAAMLNRIHFAVCPIIQVISLLA